MSTYVPNEYSNATPRRKSQLNEATKNWRKRNPELIKEIRRKTDEKRKQVRRERRYLENYGISLEEYNAKLKEQGGCCAICRNPERKLSKGGLEMQPLCVDHNHTTGKIRGLLCSGCNLAIGNMKENIDYLLSAVTYLRKYDE